MTSADGATYLTYGGTVVDRECFAPTQCGEENNVCLTCNETSYLANNTCTPCPNDCRRCNGSLCLECATPFVLVDGGCVAAEHARLTDGRQAIHCDDGWVAAGTGCSACSARCQKCSETSCEICDGAFNNGTCVSPPGVEHATNNGGVSCMPGSFLTSNMCVSCDAFGGACQRCSPGSITIPQVLVSILYFVFGSRLFSIFYLPGILLLHEHSMPFCLQPKTHPFHIQGHSLGRPSGV